MAVGTVTEYSEPEPGGGSQINRPQADNLVAASLRGNAAVPEGVEHAEWASALDQAIHVLFPRFPAS